MWQGSDSRRTEAGHRAHPGGHASTFDAIGEKVRHCLKAERLMERLRQQGFGPKPVAMAAAMVAGLLIIGRRRHPGGAERA